MDETEARLPARQETLPFEIEQPENYAQYILHTRAEIVAVLRSLIQKRSLLSAYFDQGRVFLLTSLLDVLPETSELVLDCGRDDTINHQALSVGKLVLTAMVDKVKVQFILNQISETLRSGRPAFRAALPDKVLRLQRREYFRLATPVAKPVKFVAVLARPDGTALVAETSLLDISAGGIGLMATRSLAELLPRGSVLHDCKMTLPDEGLLVANVCVRNSFDVTTRGGSRYIRVGCEFVALPGARMSMVQRYITRVERERKARLSGMA